VHLAANKLQAFPVKQEFSVLDLKIVRSGIHSEQCGHKKQQPKNSFIHQQKIYKVKKIRRVRPFLRPIMSYPHKINKENKGLPQKSVHISLQEKASGLFSPKTGKTYQKTLSLLFEKQFTNK